MTKAQKLKAYGLLAHASDSIKDDKELGAKVREIVKATRAEIEATRALEILQHQENEAKKATHAESTEPKTSGHAEPSP